MGHRDTVASFPNTISTLNLQEGSKSHGEWIGKIAKGECGWFLGQCKERGLPTSIFVSLEKIFGEKWCFFWIYFFTFWQLSHDSNQLKLLIEIVFQSIPWSEWRPIIILRSKLSFRCNRTEALYSGSFVNFPKYGTAFLLLCRFEVETMIINGKGCLETHLDFP